MGWLFDEDLTRYSVEKFRRAGIRGKHVKYDLQRGGAKDYEVVEIARHSKYTILTGDQRDYISMDEQIFHKTGGVWVVHTDDPDEQVSYVKETINLTGFKTHSQRKEKKVDIHPTYVQVTDCRNPKQSKRYKRKAKK